MNNKTKMYISIFSGLIHHITLSSAMRLGVLSVYYVSYLTRFNDKLTLFDGILMQPVCSFCLTLSVGLGGIIERKCGCQMYLKLY